MSIGHRFSRKGLEKDPSMGPIRNRFRPPETPHSAAFARFAVHGVLGAATARGRVRSVFQRRRNHTDARAVARQQIRNEVAHNGTWTAGTPGDHASSKDVRLRVPDDVNRATFFPRAVQLEPPRMPSKGLHPVQPQTEFLEPLVIPDGFTKASAVGANRRDNDLHRSPFQRLVNVIPCTSMVRAAPGPAKLKLIGTPFPANSNRNWCFAASRISIGPLSTPHVPTSLPSRSMIDSSPYDGSLKRPV